MDGRLRKAELYGIALSLTMLCPNIFRAYHRPDEGRSSCEMEAYPCHFSVVWNLLYQSYSSLWHEDREMYFLTGGNERAVPRLPDCCSRVPQSDCLLAPALLQVVRRAWRAVDRRKAQGKAPP
jgi:hypothetical protein